MNNIIIIDSIVVIVVMIEIEQVENGSFQNQTESPLARRLPRRAGRQGPLLWESLKCIHINNCTCMHVFIVVSCQKARAGEQSSKDCYQKVQPKNLR